MAQEPRAAAAPESARAAELLAARLLDATANPDGRGLLLRGSEPQPVQRDALDPLVVEGLVRLARVADELGRTFRDHPDSSVRRSAAVLAARAHPILAALND